MNAAIATADIGSQIDRNVDLTTAALCHPLWASVTFYPVRMRNPWVSHCYTKEERMDRTCCEHLQRPEKLCCFLPLVALLRPQKAGLKDLLKKMACRWVSVKAGRDGKGPARASAMGTWNGEHVYGGAGRKL